MRIRLLFGAIAAAQTFAHMGGLYLSESAMKKPSIRVTKWLGDIPVEAECTACAGTHFRAGSPSHRPQREQYQQSLQRQFEAHFENVHSVEALAKPAAES